MKISVHAILVSFLFILMGTTTNILAQSSLQIPVIKNGLAQVIPELESPELWIREDLWVETEFDSNGDGKLDRMHVAITRPIPTESGLKLPIIYETSPYYAGIAGFVDGLFWDVRYELGPLSDEKKQELENKHICRSQVIC